MAARACLALAKASRRRSSSSGSVALGFAVDIDVASPGRRLRPVPQRLSRLLRRRRSSYRKARSAGADGPPTVYLLSLSISLRSFRFSLIRAEIIASTARAAIYALCGTKWRRRRPIERPLHVKFEMARQPRSSGPSSWKWMSRTALGHSGCPKSPVSRPKSTSVRTSPRRRLPRSSRPWRFPHHFFHLHIRFRTRRWRPSFLTAKGAAGRITPSSQRRPG